MAILILVLDFLIGISFGQMRFGGECYRPVQGSQTLDLSFSHVNYEIKSNSQAEVVTNSIGNDLSLGHSYSIFDKFSTLVEIDYTLGANKESGSTHNIAENYYSLSSYQAGISRVSMGGNYQVLGERDSRSIVNVHFNYTPSLGNVVVGNSQKETKLRHNFHQISLGLEHCLLFNDFQLYGFFTGGLNSKSKVEYKNPEQTVSTFEGARFFEFQFGPRYFFTQNISLNLLFGAGIQDDISGDNSGVPFKIETKSTGYYGLGGSYILKNDWLLSIDYLSVITDVNAPIESGKDLKSSEHNFKLSILTEL